MTTLTLKLYTPAPLENFSDLEQRLQKKLIDVNSFNNSNNNTNEMIDYLKYKNHKSEKKKKKQIHHYKFKIIWYISHYWQNIKFYYVICYRDHFVMIPISTGIACSLTISINVTYEIVMRNYQNYKKLKSQRDQQSIKSSDKLYRKT